jgi:hypothetical protein
MNETTQERTDRVSYDMFIDCHRDAAAAASQLGTTARTVRNRVQRHALRLVAADSHTGRTGRPKKETKP